MMFNKYYTQIIIIKKNKRIGRMTVGHRRGPVDVDAIYALLRKLRSGGHSFTC